MSEDVSEADYELAETDSNPDNMLARAVEQGADVDTIERLIELKERHEANEARKSYDAAMADLRSDLPTIAKTNTVSHKGASYDYEDLSAVVDQVAPVMAEHDLSFRWRTDSEQANEVRVTCIISHRDGYSEETTLSAQPDTSGSKNAIQAIGSTVTYLQRYTLKAAMGIAAGPDDDAQAVSGKQKTPAARNTPSVKKQKAEKQITEAQLKKLHALCGEVKHPKKAVTGDDLKELIKAGYEIDSLSDMDKSTASKVIDQLEGYPTVDDQDTPEAEKHVRSLLQDSDMDDEETLRLARNTVEDYTDGDYSEIEAWREVYSYLKAVIEDDEEFKVDNDKLKINPF